MRVFAPYQSLFHLSAFIFISPLSGMNASLYLQNPGAQTQAPAPSRPTQHDSVEVTARISPEEAEEGKLNDLYQPVYALQRGGRCTADIIRRYQVEVIQPAEKSAFNVPKSKFLFLANRDIGDCYLEFQKFPEAEASFQRALQFVSVWPGTDDSDYRSSFVKSQRRSLVNSV